MAFGDVLKKNLFKLENASKNKVAKNAFWIVLRDIAVLEIQEMYPSKVDSDIAIGIYYDILSKNTNFIPSHFKERLKSNNQERFRVINRNMWVSNAFNPDGLANQSQISACRKINIDRKGDKIVYQGIK